MPVEEALLEAGFHVDVASSGEAAVALIEKMGAKVRGVITDIRLSRTLTGWDVARRARELVPHIPIVYVSADSAATWEVEGVPNSVMIAKPYALVQVTTSIAQLLNAVSPSSAN